MAKELIFEYTEPAVKYPCFLIVNKEVDGEITITARSRVRDSNVAGIVMAGNSGCMIIPEKQISHLIVALAKLIPQAKNLVALPPPPKGIA